MHRIEVRVTTTLYRVGAAGGDRARREKRPMAVESYFIGYEAIKGEEETMRRQWMGKMKSRRWCFGLASRVRGRMIDSGARHNGTGQDNDILGLTKVGDEGWQLDRRSW
jgi:hypothetical protein